MILKVVVLLLFCATSQASQENKTGNFDNKPIIQQCCFEDGYIDVSENEDYVEFKCQDKIKFPKLLTPAIYYENLTIKSEEIYEKFGDNFKIVNENPCELLNSGKHLNILDFEDIYLLENATIIHVNSTIINYRDYCIGGVIKNGQYRSKILVCPLRGIGKIYMTILKLTKFLLIPCLFLGLYVFLIYKLLPKLTSIRKCILLYHVSAFFMAYITMNFIIIGNWKTLHVVAGYLSYFFFIASWTSLITLCFDVRWTLGGIKWELNPTKRVKECRLYAIYGWGSAAMLTIFCFLIENDFIPLFNSIKPNFGLDNCGLTNKKSMEIYFFVPICFTIVSTIAIFISILRRKRYVRTIAQYSIEKLEFKRHQDNTNWIKLTFYLFILNLFNWFNDYVWLYFFNC